MDKKPFEQRGGQGPGAQQGSVKPEPGRKSQEESEKNRTRRPAPPRESRPVDKPVPNPEAELEREDILEDERSDQKSGRPVQLEARDKARPAFGGRPQEGVKSREGQSTPS